MEEITNTNENTNKNEINFQNFNKLREEDVGISEYLNKNSLGFTCVLKHRFSDFLVNEIDMEGNVVWVKTPKIEEKIKENSTDEPSSREELDSLVDKNFGGEKGIISNHEDLSSLKIFLFNCLNPQSSIHNEEPLFIGFIEDKNVRKCFHEKIREHFPFLETETLNEGQIFKSRNVVIHSKKNIKKDERSDDKEISTSISLSNSNDYKKKIN